MQDLCITLRFWDIRQSTLRIRCPASCKARITSRPILSLTKKKHQKTLVYFAFFITALSGNFKKINSPPQLEFN